MMNHKGLRCWRLLWMTVLAGFIATEAGAQDKSFMKRRSGSTELPPYEVVNAVWKVEGEVIEYDPDTKVYIDALFFRARAENDPDLILKDHKQTMTLAEADKAGARILGFPGYQRKYPLNIISDDHVMYGPARNGVHYFGCIYIEGAHSGTQRKTVKEWKAAGERFCHRCGGRRRVGPSYTLTAEEWQKVTADFKKIEEESERQRQAFAPPEGWTPTYFSPDELPPKEDIEMIVRSALEPDVPSKLEALYFKDRVAMHETLMTKRFFFNPPQTYYAYRATGDQRLLDQLLRFARNRKALCDEALDAYQLKASTSEGVPALFTMVAGARIILQKAVKDPGSVSEEELAEAEALLRTAVKALKPTWESNDDLDPDMGIPRKVADDFRRRAFNRAANGIGTLAMAAAALEDLQTITGTTEHQPRIDRYRTCVTEWVRNWKNVGCLFTEPDGRKYFYYPYSARDIVEPEPEGFKLFRSDDIGHYSHTMQGVMLMYEAYPESGVDDEFMTAIANAVHHTKYTKNGSIQTPSADRKRPYSRKKRRGSGSMGDRFYMFEAFKEGIINSPPKRTPKRPEQERLKLLHAQYMKALRNDRSLIHLGETM